MIAGVRGGGRGKERKVEVEVEAEVEVEVGGTTSQPRHDVIPYLLVGWSRLFA